MENIRTLTEFMGGSAIVGSPRSDTDFITLIRNGLPAGVINSVVKSSAISEDIILKSLHIAKRTAARRKATATLLKLSESESIFRFSQVLVVAEDVLGSSEKAKIWLFAENTALNGERPIDMLDTGIGYENVMDTLRRIEFGVYS